MMFAGRRVIVVSHRNGCRSRRGTPPGWRQTLGTGIDAAVFTAIGPWRNIWISVVVRDSGGVNFGWSVFVNNVTVLHIIVLTRLRYVFAKVVVMVLQRIDVWLIYNYNDNLIQWETFVKRSTVLKYCIKK